MRECSHKHSDKHRKKLYCIHCRQEVNHYECKTEKDIADFKAAFERGDFIEEAKISLEECKHDLFDF